MPSSTAAQAVKITIYKWAGKWGPFKVSVPCGECTLTLDIVKDTLASDLAGIPVEIATREWLSEWWKPLLKGGYHAPIVMVGGKVISQGAALNRGVLAEKVIQEYVGFSQLQGNVVYGKATCPHCIRAKEYLDGAGIQYTYYDVVKNPRALYEMIPRVKEIIGEKTPVTVPQIWLDGKYVGGADELSKLLECDVEPNYDRGQCSMSPVR
jgi:glutaredoxin